MGMVNCGATYSAHRNQTVYRVCSSDITVCSGSNHFTAQGAQKPQNALQLLRPLCACGPKNLLPNECPGLLLELLNQFLHHLVDGLFAEGLAVVLQNETH